MARWLATVITLAMLALGCGVANSVREVDGGLELRGNASYKPEIVLDLGGGTYRIAMHMGGLQTLGAQRDCGPWVQITEAESLGVPTPLQKVPENLDPGVDVVLDVDLPAGRYVLRSGVDRCDWVIRMSGPEIALESVGELAEPSG